MLNTKVDLGVFGFWVSFIVVIFIIVINFIIAIVIIVNVYFTKTFWLDWILVLKMTEWLLQGCD